jgi:maleate isomerase
MRRLGVLTPSSNTVLEPVTARLAQSLAEDLELHFTRLRVTAIDDGAGSHEQFSSEAMVEAARMLADARVDMILWGGTSGAWEGIDADRDIVASIESATGTSALTATLALLQALRSLRVHRYALVVPYIESIVEAIVANLEREGYACVGRAFESMTVNWEFAAIPSARIAARVREVARSQPEAIVVHCTNLRGAAIAVELERELGIPVLDSVMVGLWGAFATLGLTVPPSFGMLSHVRADPRS